MATTLFTSTTITTTTTLLYQGSTGRPPAQEGTDNKSASPTSPSETPEDIVSIGSNDQDSASYEKLKAAAKNYLETLQTIGRALGFQENNRFTDIAKSIVRGSSGDDQITTLGKARIKAGAGDDEINATGRSRINGGSGDDFINALGRSRIRGGSGDDIINTLGRSRINSGSGDDIITAAGRSRIKAGSGDDIISAFGSSHINAGSGDDIINAAGRSRIRAGSGDDIINAYGRSNITAGAGDDVIIVGGESATINFAKGDGSDTIFAATDVNINIGEGLTEDALTITYEAGKATISFEGSDDELTLYFEEGSNVSLNFENGKSLELTPTIDIGA